MKVRKYKGYDIKDWNGPLGMFPDAGEPKCYVQTHHKPTGIPYGPELCPAFRSYKQAKWWINSKLASKATREKFKELTKV